MEISQRRGGQRTRRRAGRNEVKMASEAVGHHLSRSTGEVASEAAGEGLLP
jgi:hypothetical protein